MSSRSILASAIFTAFVVFVPIDDVFSPLTYLIGLLSLLIVVALDCLGKDPPSWSEKAAAWLFLIGLIFASASVLLDLSPRHAQPLEPEENISSASL